MEAPDTPHSWDTLLCADDASAQLQRLADGGTLARVLPEVDRLRACTDPQGRHKDVWAHTLQVVAQSPAEPLLRWAALLHDIGKPDTRRIEGGRATFRNHDVVGARLARPALERIGHTREFVDDVCDLVRLHLRAHDWTDGFEGRQGGDWSDAAVRRYATDAGSLLDALQALSKADCTSKHAWRRRQVADAVDALTERIRHVQAADADKAVRPPIDGLQIAAHLGIEPGPQLGHAWRHLQQAARDGRVADEADAYAELDRWQAVT